MSRPCWTGSPKHICQLRTRLIFQPSPNRCAGLPTPSDSYALSGLNEPDAVDDIIMHLVPKYAGGSADIDGDEYTSDIRRILRTFESSTGGQKQRLTDALSTTAFVRLVDAADPSTRAWGQPSMAYLTTEELTGLFDGVRGIRFVDRKYDCLLGEKVDQLLEACGSAKSLGAVRFKNESRFSCRELKKMRLDTRGNDGSTGQESILGLAH